MGKGEVLGCLGKNHNGGVGQYMELSTICTKKRVNLQNLKMKTSVGNSILQDDYRSSISAALNQLMYV